MFLGPGGLTESCSEQDRFPGAARTPLFWPVQCCRRSSVCALSRVPRAVLQWSESVLTQEGHPRASEAPLSPEEDDHYNRGW